MSSDTSEMPEGFDQDLDEMARQMDKALAEAKEMLDQDPGPAPGVAGDNPAGVPSPFEQQQYVAPRIEWALRADIRLGETLHVVVDAVFDLEQILAARERKQNWTEGDTERTDEWPIARVENVDVVKCWISDVLMDVADVVAFSPQSPIPLVVDGEHVGFEFAPVLTVPEEWRDTGIPVLKSTSGKVVVPLGHFSEGEPLSLRFSLNGHKVPVSVVLDFEPLADDV